jgi:hypothetical protein
MNDEIINYFYIDLFDIYIKALGIFSNKHKAYNEKYYIPFNFTLETTQNQINNNGGVLNINFIKFPLIDIDN